MADSFAHVENEPDDEFYGKELRRAGAALARIRRERDEAWDMCFRLVAAAGSIRMSYSMMVEDPLPIVRVEDLGTDTIEFRLRDA